MMGNAEDWAFATIMWAFAVIATSVAAGNAAVIAHGIWGLF